MNKNNNMHIMQIPILLAAILSSTACSTSHHMGIDKKIDKLEFTIPAVTTPAVTTPAVTQIDISNVSLASYERGIDQNGQVIYYADYTGSSDSNTTQNNNNQSQSHNK